MLSKDSRLKVCAVWVVRGFCGIQLVLLAGFGWDWFCPVLGVAFRAGGCFECLGDTRRVCAGKGKAPPGTAHETRPERRGTRRRKGEGPARDAWPRRPTTAFGVAEKLRGLASLRAERGRKPVSGTAPAGGWFSAAGGIHEKSTPPAPSASSQKLHGKGMGNREAKRGKAGIGDGLPRGRGTARRRIKKARGAVPLRALPRHLRCFANFRQGKGEVAKDWQTAGKRYGTAGGILPSIGKMRKTRGGKPAACKSVFLLPLRRVCPLQPSDRRKKQPSPSAKNSLAPLSKKKAVLKWK